MTKQELVQRMQDGQAWIPGKRVKIDFGGEHGAIMLDGAAQQVSEDGGDADTTIKVGWDDWNDLHDHPLRPIAGGPEGIDHFQPFGHFLAPHFGVGIAHFLAQVFRKFGDVDRLQ